MSLSQQLQLFFEATNFRLVKEYWAEVDDPLRHGSQYSTRYVLSRAWERMGLTNLAWCRPLSWEVPNLVDSKRLVRPCYARCQPFEAFNFAPEG